MKKCVLFVLTLLFWVVEMQCFASPQIQIGNNPPQNVKAEGKVNDTKVKVAKPFTLDLSLKVPYGWFVEWNDFSADSLSDQIDIINRGNVERTADADSNIIVHQQLTLMTFDTGQIQLPPIGLIYAKGSDAPIKLEAYTKAIDLYSTTISVDTLQPFKPIVEPISAPIQMKEVLPWIIAAVLLILLALGIWYWVKHRKPRLDAHGNVIHGPVIPPYDKAVDALDNLRQQKLWMSDKVKEHYSSLTDIARDYIEGQFGVNAVEMTTDDILEDIKSMNFAEETYNKLKETMEVADLVKFAKYASSNLESENALNKMTDFVNESYEHYQKSMSPSASPQMDKNDRETPSSTMKEEEKDV